MTLLPKDIPAFLSEQQLREESFRLRNRLAAICEDHAAGRVTDKQFMDYVRRTTLVYTEPTSGAPPA